MGGDLKSTPAAEKVTEMADSKQAVRVLETILNTCDSSILVGPAFTLNRLFYTDIYDQLGRIFWDNMDDIVEGEGGQYAVRALLANGFTEKQVSTIYHYAVITFSFQTEKTLTTLESNLEFVLERSYGIILPAILDACAKYVSRYKINKSISTNYLRRNPAIGEKTFDAIVSLVYPEFSPENSDKLFMNMLSYKSDEEGIFFFFFYAIPYV